MQFDATDNTKRLVRIEYYQIREGCPLDFEDKRERIVFDMQRDVGCIHITVGVYEPR